MSSSATLRRPEPIARSHRLERFDCGAAELNEFLLRHAWASHQSGSARTFVATTGNGDVVGFYSLAASQVLHADAPARMQKGVARHPVPVVLLARLAVDRAWQGKGQGSALLKDAILRVLGAAEGIGIRAILVYAKDEAAMSFYLRHDFSAMPGCPMHLVLLLKDARRAAGAP